MKNLLFVPLILAIILLSGCIGEKTTITETEYVCHDGSVVSNPVMCPEAAPEKVIVTRYVCPDDSVVENPDDCPEKETETVTVTKYVCPDGKVVDSPDGCLTTTTELGTTTTIKITSTQKATTTTVAELGTTNTSTSTTTTTISEITDSCIELGCPSGTKFVGSKDSDKYHYCNCRYAKRIKPENLLCFSDEKDAQAKGYVPCGVCKPPE